MHRQNNTEKADNYPNFTIGETKYKVFKQSGYYGYGILDVESNEAVEWKSKQNRYYV